MTLAIRPFRPSDAEALAAMFEAMQAHYAVPCPPRSEIMADLARLPPGIEILLAERDGHLAGFATTSPLYPGPGLRRGLFLKELYVAASARGCGVGRALMAAVTASAIASGAGRVDWTAATADTRLLDFYRGLGAAPDPGKTFFRLTGEALAKAAER